MLDLLYIAVGVIVPIVIIAAIGNAVNPNPTYHEWKELPDLRVAHLPEPLREHLEYEARAKQRQRELSASLREQHELQKAIWMEQYEQQLQERVEAWKRGEPTPKEMP